MRSITPLDRAAVRLEDADALRADCARRAHGSSTGKRPPTEQVMRSADCAERSALRALTRIYRDPANTPVA